jgi:hypothetical protein
MQVSSPTIEDGQGILIFITMTTPFEQESKYDPEVQACVSGVLESKVLLR